VLYGTAREASHRSTCQPSSVALDDDDAAWLLSTFCERSGAAPGSCWGQQLLTPRAAEQGRHRWTAAIAALPPLALPRARAARGLAGGSDSRFGIYRSTQLGSYFEFGICWR
jgi:hypothetical protein